MGSIRHFLRRTASALTLLIGVVLSVASQDLRFIEYDTDLLPPEEFRERRERLMQEMGTASVALFFSAPQKIRNGDVEYPYRQDDNFLYLTGFPESGSILLLVPAGIAVKDPADSTRMRTVREVLFVQPRNPRRETWTGRRYGPEGAVQLRGLAFAVPVSEFPAYVRRAVFGTRPEIFYFPAGTPEADGELAESALVLRAVAEGLKSSNSLVELRDPAPLVRRRRAVKSEGEIRLIARAAHISAVAHREAMKSCAPGVHEYELQAVYEYVYRRLGAEYGAYPCIVGAGENSVILHYNAVRRKINDGDVVLADCGAEYHGYAADVTRTFPASGKFSPAQRRIYDVVLRAQLTAIEMMKPGLLWSDVTTAAERVLEEGLFDLKLVKEKDGRQFRRFTVHGLGHAVGLNVHDVDLPRLEEGMVMTIEPGIYIPEGMAEVPQEYFNIGVRIEDTVLITADGAKVLSDEVPKTADDVERLMERQGVGNTDLR